MMRNITQLSPDLLNASAEIRQALSVALPRDIGEIHVEGFKRSFRMQKFNDVGETPWTEVKRRSPGSGWYGFDYNTARKNKSFSPAAKTRAILRGPGSAGLQHGIYLRTANARMISIASDTPYSQYHNEGDINHKVFGRKVGGGLPKRQFMGHSTKLDKASERAIDRRINRALKNR